MKKIKSKMVNFLLALSSQTSTYSMHFEKLKIIIAIFKIVIKILVLEFYNYIP